MKAEEKRLMSARSIDRVYSLRHGTAARAVRDGLLPARQRGRTLWCDARHAERLFGTGR